MHITIKKERKFVPSLMISKPLIWFCKMECGRKFSIQSGIDGKCLRYIINMYKGIISIVQTGQHFSDF